MATRTEGTCHAIAEALCRSCANYPKCEGRKFIPRVQTDDGWAWGRLESCAAYEPVWDWERSRGAGQCDG